MIEIKKVVNEEIKFKLHKEYINTVAEPIDGFWENVMICRSLISSLNDKRCDNLYEFAPFFMYLKISHTQWLFIR
ncbi:hypothetical protein G9F72_008235 [Clostridium estertheticum]|uniref:hypothetical protein n=1 Tax=Clostridium estertheticum TaxID=238834 RepID=UPI0013E921FE|nr:hypothetical protein [Clostridium estertheticum]MBZ9686316.1 hypothetical protein [Clostridium estertheticum]